MDAYLRARQMRTTVICYAQVLPTIERRREIAMSTCSVEPRAQSRISCCLHFGNLLTRFELLRVPTTSEPRYYPEDDEYLLEREPYVTHVLASVGDQAA